MHLQVELLCYFRGKGIELSILFRHYVTIQKVVGLISDNIIGIFALT